MKSQMLERSQRRLGFRIAAVVAVAGLTVTALVACSSSKKTTASSGGSSSSGAPQTLTDIKLGYPLPNVQSVAVQIAQNNGVFKSAGLNVTATSLGTAAVVNSALISGSVEYSLTSASQLITSVGKGAGIIALSQYTVGTPVDIIYSNQFIKAHNLSKSTPIAQLVESLKGAHVGVSSPVIIDQQNELLKAYNVDPASVNTVTVSSEGALLNLIKTGQIDAFIAGPPQPQIAADAGGGQILVTSLNAPEWSAGNANLVLAANKSYAEAHPDLTKQVVKGVAAAVQYVLQHPDDAATQSVDLLKATKAEIVASIPLAGYSKCAPMTSALWAKTLSFSQASGTLPASAKADKGTVWTNDYVAAQSGCPSD
jgi:ABC-type nitrate/sulfonate/bicarbonate transport system substrate-binding protein